MLHAAVHNAMLPTACAPEDLLSHQAVANDSPTGMTPPLEAMDAPDGLEHSALMTVHISAYHRREAAQWCIKNGNGTPRNTCAPSGARFFGALCHLWLYTSITPQETTGVLRRVFGRWENRTEKSRPGAIHGFLAYPAVRLTVVASAFRSEIGTPFGKRDACEAASAASAWERVAGCESAYPLRGFAPVAAASPPCALR